MISGLLKLIRGLSWTVLAPLLMVSTVALGLYIVGTIPGQIDSSVTGIKEYSNVEDAESDMGIKIAIPSYFPNYLTWPPISIRGQFKPVTMSQLIFLSADHNTEDLLIIQTISSEEDLPVVLPWFDSVLRKTQVTINGNEGQLIIGRRSDGLQVNGVCWSVDEIYFVIVTTHPAEEAMRLAQSVHF